MDAESALTRPRWLVLAHELPARSSNARVLTWRRLKGLGAVPLRSSVYLLPNTDACAADFEGLRKQIGALRGTAVVLVADTSDPADSDPLIEKFRRNSSGEYRRIARDVERLSASLRREARRGARLGGRQQRAVRRLQERREDIERRDFFGADGRDALLVALDRLEARESGGAEGRRAAGRATQEFQARSWVTRPRPGVDRMGSAWLIRRFIDPAATFAFVQQPGPGDVAFDMHDVGFTHQESMCTFEVLADRFQIHDSVVRRLARLVHALDLKDGRFDVPEANAVDRLISAFRAQPAPDAVLLEQGIALFDALAASLGAPTAARPRAARERASRTTSRR